VMMYPSSQRHQRCSFERCILATFCLLLTLNLAAPFSFDLILDKEKCFWEDLGKDVVVLGEYQLSPSYNTLATIEVQALLNGVIVWRKEGATEGTFAFTTVESEKISICFTDKSKADIRNPQTHIRQASLKLKTGVQAKDYSAVAKRDDLKPIELEMLKLEDLIQELNDDMKYFQHRDNLMRDTHESTNSRVLWLSFISLLTLIGLGIFQILYLKRYFKQKKLI